MNARHSGVTDWGLAHISIPQACTILDAGCGGGRTLCKLAEKVQQGKVYGIDYSEESIATSKGTNARWITTGRVEVLLGSVSQLPFSEGMFDLVTTIETHFWWPNLPADMHQFFRVLKPGGKLVVVAEVYKGANTRMARLCEKYVSRTGMMLLDIDGHRRLFTDASYSDIQISVDSEKGWICAYRDKTPTATRWGHIACFGLSSQPASCWSQPSKM